MLENRMLIDSEWNEQEYGVPLPRKRDKWEEEEEDNVEELRRDEEDRCPSIL